MSGSFNKDLKWFMKDSIYMSNRAGDLASPYGTPF